MVKQLWQARDFETEQGKHSKDSARFQFPPVIGKILAARGLLNPDELDGLFQPTLKSLKSPQSLAGMNRAVDRLFQAFKEKECVALYADFDLDGTSGLALLYRGLKSLGYESVLPFQPLRLTEGYGFHAHLAKELVEQGAKVIVTIDVGITANEAVLEAQSYGCDVIVTDHHLPRETLPQAYAVVNPNTKECDAGLGHLCGAGVAFYLLWALRSQFSKEGVLPKSFDLKSVLDCFVIGTLTDMVPLREENRVLVKHGLKVLEQTQSPGLRLLLEKLGMSQRPLSSQDVAIRFAPKLNALSRLEQGLRPIDIFLEESEENAQRLVGEVVKSNEMRLRLQKEAETHSLTLLEDWKEEAFVFVISPSFHQGVVGLVATKLAQNLGCPAFVGAVSPEGQVVGSARLPKDSPLCLVQALKAATEHLVRHGGHSAAAGFEFEELKASDVITALGTHFRQYPKGEGTLGGGGSPVIYDIDAGLGDFDESAMNWLDHLGPFGVDFEMPLFHVPRVRVEHIHQLKGGHLRLKLYDASSAVNKEAIWFFPRKEEDLKKEGFCQGAEVAILCEVQWNYFAGRKTVQILLRDLKCL